MAIGKASGGRKLGGEAQSAAARPDLPAPANDLAVNEALEKAVSAAVDTAVEPAGPVPPSAPKVDPLLNALQYLARRWGRPVSRDVLTAGLPLKNGMLTMPLMSRALER